MNAERLHAILVAIQKEVSDTSQQTNQLGNSLRKQVGSPSDGNLQVRVSNQRSQLDSFLEAADSNGFSPAWRENLQSLGIADLLGDSLRKSIVAAFDRNSVTPAAVAEEIEGYSQRLSELSTSLNAMITGFNLFKIKPETLEPGEVELGFLIPRSAVGNQLDKLGDEFLELNGVLRPFAELATGARPQFEIRAISSSEFGLFLDIDPATAACIAVAIERTINVYKSLLEIKKLRGEMVNNGMPKENLEGVDKYAEGLMKTGIAKAVQELLTKFGKVLDTGRKNELKVELTLSLNSIANRIDKGYNVEVRAQPPIASQSSAEEPAAKARAEYFATIGRASESLKYMRQDGVPMLQLPTSPPKVSSTTTEEGTPPKKRRKSRKGSTGATTDSGSDPSGSK